MADLRAIMRYFPEFGVASRIYREIERAVSLRHYLQDALFDRLDPANESSLAYWLNTSSSDNAGKYELLFSILLIVCITAA